ncbi:hypothetical protein LCL95_13505 [Bacillus timonensis]|nr:hypothetical protein [Bacillus timonensis]
MPYYSFKEIWTPMKVVKVRFFRCVENGSVFVKVGNGTRKQILGRREVS